MVIKLRKVTAVQLEDPEFLLRKLRLLFQLKHAKNAILPSKINLTDTSAEVDLQELLQKTTESILKLTDVDSQKRLKLICKWGMDGSSGHSQYKPKFSNKESTDEFLFLMAMVPLRLVMKIYSAFFLPQTLSFLQKEK